MDIIGWEPHVSKVSYGSIYPDTGNLPKGLLLTAVASILIVGALSVYFTCWCLWNLPNGIRAFWKYIAA